MTWLFVESLVRLTQYVGDINIKCVCVHECVRACKTMLLKSWYVCKWYYLAHMRQIYREKHPMPQVEQSNHSFVVVRGVLDVSRLTSVDDFWHVENTDI